MGAAGAVRAAGGGGGGKGQREQVRLRIVEPFITIDAQLPRSTLRLAHYYNMHSILHSYSLSLQGRIVQVLWALEFASLAAEGTFIIIYKQKRRFT